MAKTAMDFVTSHSPQLRMSLVVAAALLEKNASDSLGGLTHVASCASLHGTLHRSHPGL